MRIKTPCVILAIPDKEADDGFRLEIYPEKMKWYAGDDAIHVEEVELSVTLSANVDKQALAMKAIETLTERQAKVMADAVMEQGRLQKKIDALLCLPFIPQEQTATEVREAQSPGVLASMGIDEDDYDIPF